MVNMYQRVCQFARTLDRLTCQIKVLFCGSGLTGGCSPTSAWRELELDMK